MASTTKQVPAQSQASQDRDAAIAAYTEVLAKKEAAAAKGDKAAVLKIAGSLGTPVSKIRAAELEMAIEGESFTPWEKPRTARSSQLADIGTAEKVQATLDGLRKLVTESKKDRPTV